MIKYSDASNEMKNQEEVYNYSLPSKECCVSFVKEASVGYHVCDKCGNHMHKMRSDD